jgi:hypothetical protein
MILGCLLLAFPAKDQPPALVNFYHGIFRLRQHEVGLRTRRSIIGRLESRYLPDVIAIRQKIGTI